MTRRAPIHRPHTPKPVRVERCGNTLGIRLPDAPSDQWETATCIQEYGHARLWDTPCDDGSGTTWRVLT